MCPSFPNNTSYGEPDTALAHPGLDQGLYKLSRLSSVSDDHRTYGAYLLVSVRTRESGRGFEFLIEEDQGFENHLLAKLHS
jgi:hypothetical protein